MTQQTFTEPAASAEDRVTVAEAAALLGCHIETVRRAIREGRLAATRPLGSRGLLIRRADLEDAR